MVHVCCWAHSRRKFHEAVKLNPQDRVAIGLVAQIEAAGVHALPSSALGKAVTY
jgi:hypothetical protein